MAEARTLRSEADVVAVRQWVRRVAVELGFSLISQTKLVTATSELARNTVVYGGGGSVSLERIETGDRVGIRLVFEDNGPGIANLELALRDGYTTGQGLGLGLGGARRLVNEFEIQSTPEEGTRITITKWK